MNISLHLLQICKGKIDPSFLKNFLLCVINTFILISWELSSLYRNALRKLSASFAYFIHLPVGLLLYATHAFTSRIFLT